MKHRIRNKHIQAFFNFVNSQPDRKKINNASLETCAIGDYCTSIGKSLKGLDKFTWAYDPTMSIKSMRLRVQKQFPGYKLVNEINAHHRLSQVMMSKISCPKTYGAMKKFFQANFTK